MLRKLLIYCSLLTTLAVLSACSSLFVSSEPAQVEEIDTGCAYFYFLWGRQAELSMEYAEALEAYQKALICDPDATYVARKIPILLLRLNKGEEAVTLLEKQLESDPKDSSTRMLLARVYIGLGEYSLAELQYRIIYEQDPDDVGPLLLLSELFLNQNMLANAEQVLQEILQIKQDSYPARVLLARIYLNANRYTEAEKEYDAALKINWSADLLMEKADVYRDQRKFDKVIALYKEIQEKDSGNERVSLALVNLLLRIDREEEALAELNKLKEQTDLAEKVELSVARLFARLEKYDQAIELLQKFQEKVTDPDAQYLLAVVLTQAEKYEQALVELQKIHPEAEEFENGIILQVRLLRFLKRQEDAVDLLERVVHDETTRSPDLYVMLAALYHVQDNTEKGQEAFARAMAAFPENYELLYDYGLFLDTAGSMDEALEIMQEVVKRDPAHGEALNYVGYFWAENNMNLEKALEYIQKAVKLKPNNGYIHDSLGWVYYRLGKHEEARKALEKAIELSDDDPAIFDHLGDVYLELGRKADAIDAYRKGLVNIDEEYDMDLQKALQEKLQILENQAEK